MDCFVIMPISESDGYEKGHFNKVYEDIFKPACCKAGFDPVRADDVKQTNLIHLDILQKLIESPMAICDLSSRNPNVLFELGLRQAFDKPTVLVQEFGTPKIFDIAPLRYSEYRRELRYREVIEDQASISEAILATKNSTDKGEGVNSIIKILSLSKPATLMQAGESDSGTILQLIRAEMSEMRSDFRQVVNMMEFSRERNSISEINHPTMTRLREARDLINEADFLLDTNGKFEIIVDIVVRAQKLLIKLLQPNNSVQVRSEAKNMFNKCEQIESRLRDRNKPSS